MIRHEISGSSECVAVMEGLHMSNIQIGSLVLNAELLVYLIAGVAGVLAVRLRSRGHQEQEKLVSAAWSAVFLWVVSWKGSLLLFDPMSVINHPQSLLFFDGGTKGFWLATLVAIGFMVFRLKARIGIVQAGLFTAAMTSGWTAVFFLAQIGLSSSVGIVHYAALLLSVALLFLLLDPARRLTLRFAAQLLGLSLIIVLIGYMVHDQIERGLFSDGNSTAIVDEGNQAVIGIRVGQSAPDFQVVDLQGNPVKLSDYRGQKVMINFWTTWCNVCKAEMPHVEKLYEYYKDQSVMILSVNVTSQERNTQDVERYVDHRELSFPIVLDEAGKVSERYRVAAYPTTFIVDASGVIRRQHVGAISFESMRKALQDI